MITTTALASLLTWLLETTIKGSLLVLLVLAINALVARHLDARWRHLLWVIVIVRLLLPAAPASPLSLFNFFPADDPLVRASGSVASVRIAVAADGSVAPARIVAVQEPRVIALARWIAAIWSIGFLALVLRTILATLRTRRAIALALRRGAPDERLQRLLDDARRRLGISRPLRIAECDAIRTPALHGVFRPVVLLPTGMTGSFSIEELRYVILHELWHLRRMDVAVSWGLSTVQALHWFNPLVWFAASRIREERELACDELALSCLEEDERLGYGRTILKLLASFQTHAPVPALVGIVNGKQKMKRRLTMIASFRNRTRFSMFLLALVAALGVVALTDATAGEHRIMVRHAGAADPAALPTIERMHKSVSFSLTNATFGELLNAVATNGGVAVTQVPELATLPVQRARFTLDANNVPLQAVLMEALMPFELAAVPSASGITIKEGKGHDVLIARGDHLRHEEINTTAGDGKKAEKRVIVLSGPEGKAALEAMRSHEGELPPGAIKHKVMIDARVNGNAKSFDENGKLHRELKLTLTDNGVASEGTLTIDITK